MTDFEMISIVLEVMNLLLLLSTSIFALLIFQRKISKKNAYSVGQQSRRCPSGHLV